LLPSLVVSLVVLLLFLFYPPSASRSDRTLTKFRAIVSDVQPSVIMTTTALAARVDDLLKLTPELRSTRVLVTNTLPPMWPRAGNDQL